MPDVRKVVLAYSGGLDTSVIVRWLQETYRSEVVTFTADLGQGEELEPIREKALLAGATESLVDNLIVLLQMGIFYVLLMVIK